MLVRFQDKVFLNIGSKWFIWESSWDRYRPIDGMKWNGTQFILDDVAYCTDPSSELYGYGSQTMSDFCSALGEKYDATKAKQVDSIAIGNSPIWFRDRMISLTPCAPKDVASWKRMLCGGRARTCRNITRNRFTKRNLPT
jgi:hypothetical protein